VTGVALIDYGAGNIRSVENALKAAGASDIAVTADPAIVRAAHRIVLPGVGAFAHCMNSLSAIPGMIDALTVTVLEAGRPFLGICVGMQLLADEGREHGVTPGLGWIYGEVEPLVAAGPTVRIPHMGWNRVDPMHPHPLIERGEAYFLHSYHFNALDGTDVIAMSDHGQPFVAAVARNNIAGVQFHPEKSQAYGIATLQRFLKWRP
jgi:imidazole glycerol-phosphate synthase subunit HisH